MALDLNDLEDMLTQVQNREGDYLATLDEAIAAVHKAATAECQALSVTISGHRLVQHFEGCEVYAPGVLVDPKTDNIFTSEAEARKHYDS